MPVFRYKAITAGGDSIEGEMEAVSRDDVVVRLQDQGHIALDARPSSEGSGGFSLAPLFRRSEFSQEEVASFTYQLSTLLGAGQPLDRALQILLDMPESDGARRLIERVRDAVRGGGTLSAALEQQHGVFSRLYVNMVRAGESSGQLDSALRRLAEYIERNKALRDSVVSALIYPALLLVMVVGAVLMLLIYVVPQFVPLFKDFNVELSLLTRSILFAGDLLRDWWWLGLVVAAFAFLRIRKAYADPERRKGLHEWALGLPRVGDLIVKTETARLARTLGTLVGNGVPLLSALSIGRNVIGNLVLSEALEQATSEVKTGGGLAWALSQSKRFPRLAIQMVQVGEESGALDAMLTKVADTYDVEVKRSIDRLLGLLVPAITILMALLVGVIMLAVLLPVLDLATGIK